MSAAIKWKLVSVEDYLAGELESPIKHEYLGGVVYAMAGARNVHNTIVGNTFAKLHFRLSGRACQPFNSDTKIRVRMPTQTRFYYPDVSVVCRPNPDDDSYQDEPTVIAEVLSKRTRRTDEGEKKDAYLTIPSLNVYMLIEQEAALVHVYRRTETGGFDRETYEGHDAVIPLSEINAVLPLAEIYGGVRFAPEPSDYEEA
jgi:Uma2 family endonuclease